MHQENPSVQGGGGFFMGLICGVAFGVTAALMFAPFAGTETLERLASQAQRFKNKTTDAYDRVSRTVDDTVKKAGEMFSESAKPMDSDYRS